MFLTAEDLENLTGYVVAAYQCKWLDRNGYPFELTRAGRPRVLRAFVEKRLGLDYAAVASEVAPDFSKWAK